MKNEFAFSTISPEEILLINGGSISAYGALKRSIDPYIAGHTSMSREVIFLLPPGLSNRHVDKVSAKIHASGHRFVMDLVNRALTIYPK